MFIAEQFNIPLFDSKVRSTKKGGKKPWTLHDELRNAARVRDLDRIKMMKKTSKIINVARGGIINENDLSKALNEELISGAAIDVFTKEPIDDKNNLLTAKNILLTPHLGASTFEAKEGVSIGVCHQITEYFLNDSTS